MRSRSGIGINRRRGSDDCGKVPGHVALVSEAGFGRSGSERGSVSKKDLNLSHFQPDMVGVWWHSGVLLEEIDRLASTEANDGRKRFEPDIGLDMCVKVIDQPCAPAIIVPALGLRVGHAR